MLTMTIKTTGIESCHLIKSLYPNCEITNDTKLALHDEKETIVYVAKRIIADHIKALKDVKFDMDSGKNLNLELIYQLETEICSEILKAVDNGAKPDVLIRYAHYIHERIIYIAGITNKFYTDTFKEAFTPIPIIMEYSEVIEIQHSLTAAYQLLMSHMKQQADMGIIREDNIRGEDNE